MIVVLNLFDLIKGRDKNYAMYLRRVQSILDRHGAKILSNFLRRIAGLHGTWSMDEFIEREIEELRERIGDGHVIFGASGGVDSTVVAVLLHRAIGDRLHCIFVDNGVLRLGEVEEVEEIFRDHLKIPLQVVRAADDFLDRLRGVEDPEKKRVTIGHTFVEHFDAAAAEIDANNASCCATISNAPCRPAKTTPARSRGARCALSAPNPNIAKKSSAIGPTCRIESSSLM